MCSEHLHELPVGQNHLTQSLFDNEVLNILHNLWNTVQLWGVGEAVRRYPTSKIRSSSCTSLERPWGDTPCPRSEKSQQEGRHWRGDCTVLKQLWGDTPHPRAKEKSQKDGMRGKFTFRIKPNSCQRHTEGSNKSCVHQDPGTPQRLRQNCAWASPVEVQVSRGLPQGQRLWVQQT